VVIVPKKNGKARFCIDYRRLNNIIKKDAYPLPRMENCLDILGDAQVFTSLNCIAGYWKVPLRKEDQEKTALTTHCDIYHWLSMPFGLTNAPATFQRALDIILSGLKWQICLIYLDDVIIFSANAEQHVKDVDTVLHRLREAGDTLNLEKCTWFYLPYQTPTGCSSSTLTHAPNKLVVHSSTRHRANCFILSDIGAKDSLLQSKTTPNSKTERECLGVVWAVLKLRHFLDGQRFLIRTDHQALS